MTTFPTPARNVQTQPFLKWAGGKRQLLRQIQRYLPSRFHTYYEPFVGGGAVLFGLQPGQAVINDVNPELINTYKVIRNHLEELLADLSKHENTRDYFYALRELDRKPGFQQLSSVERASRLIYLNKTCYNGLFRVNRNGFFNVPFGAYKKPNIVNEPVLRSVHDYLSHHPIEILNTDFAKAAASAKEGDFVYLDPPYDPVSETSSFTGYSLAGFSRHEQTRLRETVDDLTNRGCLVMLSNSATEFIRELYKDYEIILVEASRAINSNPDKRGKIDEVLILNYKPPVSRLRVGTTTC